MGAHRHHIDEEEDHLEEEGPGPDLVQDHAHAEDHTLVLVLGLDLILRAPVDGPAHIPDLVQGLDK